MLTFDDYRKLAKDKSLKPYQMAGFDPVYRESTEASIFPDLRAKLPRLEGRGGVVMDIGCGCTLPVQQLMAFCEANGHTLVVVDSEEVLENLPDRDFVHKMPHEFPRDAQFLQRWHQRVDVIICYSLLHMLFPFQNVYTFTDQLVSLLASGGQALVGDIANISKKRRYLSSPSGQAFHREWSGSDEVPEVDWMAEYDGVDDSVLLHLMLRYRSMGMETYLLPQPDGLALNHTREDLLICRR